MEYVTCAFFLAAVVVVELAGVCLFNSSVIFVLISGYTW